MATVDTIDVVTGLHGKYGSNRKDYFATNTSSKKIRLARLNNPYKGPATEKQLAHMEEFKSKALKASAWLNANKPSEANGDKGTAAYQQAQRIKRQLALSNIRQVVCKYMDEDGKVELPAAQPAASPQPSQNGEGEQTGNGGNTNPDPTPGGGDNGDKPNL
ncbi:MAG: hypothetical protein IJS06_05470 [Prevotella sp.]|nr:hypothetical protein [Prevotella sp.]